MGTHPTSPSQTLDGTLLKDLLTPANLSHPIAQKYDNDLPFLFKVLSIRKALSIQSHPDKILARELHERFPSVYKDSNHKPEMVCDLTT